MNLELSGKDLIEKTTWNPGFDYESGVIREDSLYVPDISIPFDFMDEEEAQHKAMDRVEELHRENDSLGGIILWLKEDSETLPFCYQVWRCISLAGEENYTEKEE